MVAGENDERRDTLVARVGEGRADALLAELDAHDLVVLTSAEYAALQEMAIRYRRLEALVHEPSGDADP